MSNKWKAIGYSVLILGCALDSGISGGVIAFTVCMLIEYWGP